MRNDLFVLCSFLRRERGEIGTELFALGFGDRTYGDGSKTLRERLRCNTRKQDFY